MITSRHRTFRTLLLIPFLSALQLQPAHAAMVTTGQALAHEQANTARDKVQAFVSRTDVQQRLQALGIKADNARARVAALSDTEVVTLANNIDRLPAGGHIGSTDLIIILLVVLLVVIVI